jgi:hypothetical protein
MRLFPLLHRHIAAEDHEGQALSQQALALLLMLEWSVVLERKKASLPQSVPGF